MGESELEYMRKKHLKFKQSRALTLIELLIYLAITTIVLVVVISLMTSIAKSKSQSFGQGDINQNGRFFTERVTYSVQQASDISGSYPADNLNLTINTVSAVFSLSGGQIFYQEGAGPSLPLTSPQVEISSINPGEGIFEKTTNNNAQSVQVKFKVKFKETGFSQDFQTSVLARGK